MILFPKFKFVLPPSAKISSFIEKYNNYKIK